MSTTDPADDGQPFVGWVKPYYTPIPDNFFDWVMAKLPPAELRVILYIFRRTLGFKREADSISIDQIMKGLRARDGRRLELGTGLKRTAVTDALRSLIQRGMIEAHQNTSTEFGSRPTTYSLRFVDGGSAEADGGIRSSGRGGSASAAGLPLEDKQTGDIQSDGPDGNETEDPAALWAAALEQLRGLVGSNVIHFDNTAGARLDAGVLVVSCPDPAAMVKWTKYAEMAAGRAVRFVRS